MLELFNTYKNAGKISQALMVGRNAFNRNSDNAEVFDAYFSYLCTLAETLPALADRSHFVDQANVALSFYIENADLTESVVGDIMEYRWFYILGEQTITRVHYTDTEEEIFVTEDVANIEEDSWEGLCELDFY